MCGVAQPGAVQVEFEGGCVDERPGHGGRQGPFRNGHNGDGNVHVERLGRYRHDGAVGALDDAAVGADGNRPGLRDLHPNRHDDFRRAMEYRQGRLTGPNSSDKTVLGNGDRIRIADNIDRTRGGLGYVLLLTKLDDELSDAVDGERQRFRIDVQSEQVEVQIFGLLRRAHSDGGGSLQVVPRNEEEGTALACARDHPGRRHRRHPRVGRRDRHVGCRQEHVLLVGEVAEDHESFGRPDLQTQRPILNVEIHQWCIAYRHADDRAVGGPESVVGSHLEGGISDISGLRRKQHGLPVGADGCRSMNGADEPVEQRIPIRVNGDIRQGNNDRQIHVRCRYRQVDLDGRSHVCKECEVADEDLMVRLVDQAAAVEVRGDQVPWVVAGRPRRVGEHLAVDAVHRPVSVDVPGDTDLEFVAPRGGSICPGDRHQVQSFGVDGKQRNGPVVVLVDGNGCQARHDRGSRMQTTRLGGHGYPDQDAPGGRRIDFTAANAECVTVGPGGRQDAGLRTAEEPGRRAKVSYDRHGHGWAVTVGNRLSAIKTDGHHQQVHVGRVVAVSGGIPAGEVAYGCQVAAGIVLVDQVRAVRRDDPADPAGSVADELNGLAAGGGDAAIAVEQPLAGWHHRRDHAPIRLDQVLRAVRGGQHVVLTLKERAGRVVGLAGALVMEPAAGFRQHGGCRVQRIADARIGLPSRFVVDQSGDLEPLRSEGEPDSLLRRCSQVQPGAFAERVEQAQFLQAGQRHVGLNVGVPAGQPPAVPERAAFGPHKRVVYPHQIDNNAAQAYRQIGLRPPIGRRLGGRVDLDDCFR